MNNMDAQAIINEPNFESDAVHYARLLYGLEDNMQERTLKYCRRFNGTWEISEN